MRSLLEALARAPAAVIAAVLAAVVLGAGLSGFGIAELTRGDGDGVTTAGPARTAEGPSVVAGEEQEGAQQPEARAEEEPATEPATPARAGGVPIWPEGLTAHTVVLVTTSDRAAAFRVAKAASATGLEAGLMPSDPYDLGTGLWIVYSGRFTTAEGAQRQASDLAERYPGAYPQLIQSSQ